MGSECENLGILILRRVLHFGKILVCLVRVCKRYRHGECAVCSLLCRGLGACRGSSHGAQGRGLVLGLACCGSLVRVLGEVPCRLGVGSWLE